MAPMAAQWALLGVLLGALAPSLGELGGLARLAGLAVALLCAGGGWVLLAQALSRHGRGLGPADQVTVTRGTLTCVVAALTTASVLGGTVLGSPVGSAVVGSSVAGSAGSAGSVVRSPLVTLAAVALALDAVDGWVARRTRTATPLGARFDMEVDAFLILVLSVAASLVLGWWVLAIGLFRYLLVAATWVAPWLGASVPPRYWRKVVAALQGIVLTLATADVLPRPVLTGVAAAALVLLAWSFGTQGAELWQAWAATTVPAGRTQDGRARGRTGHRREHGQQDKVTVSRPDRADRAQGSRARRSVATVVGLVPLLVVWVVLVAPDDPADVPLTWLLRVPVEPLLLGLLLLVLPGRWRRRAGLVLGAVLGFATVVKLLDLGFTAALRRPFDLLADWTYLRSARDLLAESVGASWATVALVGAAALVVGLLVVVPWSLRGVTRRLEPHVDHHRHGWSRALVVGSAVWLAMAVTQVDAAGLPLASTSSIGLIGDHVAQTRAGLRDRAAFATAVATDPYAAAAGADLLTGLRGKDVLVVFVESYGEVAVTGSPAPAGVAPALDRAKSRLGAAGFSTRSAWLASPTFGGTSWLAHSTLQSGVWVDSQRRYDQLVSTDRLTLSGAFGRAGWHTVVDVPSNRQDWPEASSFYHYDQVYDARNVGYAGPRFGYATMPDQYTLKAFADRELTRGERPPVMAEIDLVTSHVPWAPLPRLVDWDSLGDGSAFGPIRDRAATRAQVWRDPASVRAAYAESISYSIDSLVELVQQARDKDLVMVLLGDHQPSTVVSGPQASHRVPVTLVAHDPAVTRQIAGWGWQDGMRPSPDAPVWRMDAFRDRVLTTFGHAAGTRVEAAG